ncbi:hypothetical protein NFI96_003873 [Prochilodus magdalenae]|nr:hypothetical protein NFI96_003873 [Prochilodus magdalenae]
MPIEVVPQMINWVQVKTALICEKHKAPVADLPILVFCGKCQSSSTVLASEHRAHYRTSGPQAALMRPVSDCLTVLGDTANLVAVAHIDISKCVEDVTTTKTVTCYPNQKPWLNGEVRSLLKARDAAFRSGDAQELRRARRELTAGVKRAKAAYALKIQGHFSSQDPRSMWRGIKCITDYKTRDAQCSKDPSLPEALNKFYARFEDPDTPPSIRLTPTPGEVPLSVTPAEVRRTLRRINPRKSAGPDNIPGRVLRECADQISEVLADIFNVSLTQAAVPTCLKTATIIPVPKSSSDRSE